MESPCKRYFNGAAGAVTVDLGGTGPRQFTSDFRPIDWSEPFLVIRRQPRPKFMRTFSIIPGSGRLIAWGRHLCGSRRKGQRKCYALTAE
jgi:hypothetical protein